MANQTKKTEAVTLMVWAWLAMLALEGVHQVLNVVLSSLNLEALRATMRTAIKDQGQQVSDAMLRLATYGSIVLSASVACAIIVLLAIMLRLLSSGSKHSATARRMMFIFSVYFGLRVFLVFVSHPAAGSDAPDWLYAIDGMVQIAAGVAAVMGLLFSVQRESLDYTGELEELRRLEAELKKRDDEDKKK